MIRIESGIRKFLLNLAILSCLGLALAACNGAGGNSDRPKVVGVLQLIDVLDPVVIGLKEGLAELDFVEGQNIDYLYRNIKGDTSLLQGYLTEMIDAEVDVIVSISDPPTMAAKQATQGTSMPVIFTVVSNPLESGLVKSLSQPVANMTGVMAGINLAAAKRLELLLHVDPSIERVLVVYSEGKTSFPGIPEMREAAPKLGVELVAVEVPATEEAEAVFRGFAPGEIDAVFMPVDKPIAAASERLQQLIKRDRIPLISPSGVRGNSMMSYGPDLREMGAQMGVMVSKVLNGTAPGTLPVELPRVQKLTLFLGAAKEAGYVFSENALALADTLVE